jgi:hypothetical protein
MNRLGARLASRSRRVAVLVLALAVILVLTGVMLLMSHFDQAPYPSEKTGFSFVDGKVLYTQEFTFSAGFNNTTSPCVYTGMKIHFQTGTVMSGLNWYYFGDQSQLSTHARATMNQSLAEGYNASMEITDLTGDGGFNKGDTILFTLAPLLEDTVYTMGLAFTAEGQTVAVIEQSFAIHDGEFYTWNSHYLNTGWPPWWN